MADALDPADSRRAELGLGVLDQAGHIQAWQIYLFTFISSSVGSFDGPARQALFPSLVPRSVLPNAVALNSLLWKGAALLGPTLGGIAIAAMGTAGAFYANAASFFVVVIALLLMRASTPPAEKRRHFSRKLRRDFLISSRGRSFSGSGHGGFRLGFRSRPRDADDFRQRYFSRRRQGFGFLQSARGLGAVIGSSIFIGMGQRPYQGKILFVSAILYGAGFALFGLSPSFPIALALLTFVGAADTIWGASRGTILQMLTPEKFRGRVMGVFQLSNRGLHPLGQMETGLIVPLIGAREATFAGGMIISVMTLLTVWRVPQIVKFRWDHIGSSTTDSKVAEEERIAG